MTEQFFVMAQFLLHKLINMCQTRNSSLQHTSAFYIYISKSLCVWLLSGMSPTTEKEVTCAIAMETGKGCSASNI